jgi:hypothetical protein
MIKVHDLRDYLSFPTVLPFYLFVANSSLTKSLPSLPSAIPACEALSTFSTPPSPSCACLYTYSEAVPY